MMFRHISTLLSLVPTPLLILISSSSALYLRNQAELHHRPGILFPFVVGFAAILTVGLVVYALSGKRWFRFALTAYYVMGPFYLLFAVLRNLEAQHPILGPLYQTSMGLAIWPVLFVAVALVVDVRVPRDSLTNASAVFGVLLLAAEASIFWSEVESPRGETAELSAIMEKHHPLPTSLPNIYHFVMDGFQTDFFEKARTTDTDEAFDGFTFYPSNSSVYHTTPLSLGSVFLGRKYSYDRTRLDYFSQTFNARSSLLYWLREQGYMSLGFFPGRGGARDVTDSVVTRQEANLFDHVVSMDTEVWRELGRMDETDFRNLWLYSFLPGPLRELGKGRGWFIGMDEEDLRLLAGDRLLTRSAAVISRMGFEAILEEEGNLPDSGRYTYIHLLIPHWPFELEADCSSTEGAAKTGPIEQSKCGLLLIERFVEALKDLDRFDDSMVLIHGDHGAFFRTRDGSLTPFPRSRSLRATLLLKPFGRTSSSGFRESETQTSLLDIKPVIMKSVMKVQQGTGQNDDQEAMDPRGVIIPHIEGETLDSARLILERRGFTLGCTVEACLSSYPPNKVIAQDPSPYAEASHDLVVNLLISRGSAEVMPDFVGRQIADVLPMIIERAREGGLSNARIHYVQHVGFPRGSVVRQSPKAGVRLDTEVQISLYVCKGS